MKHKTQHQKHMKKALKLARRGLFTTGANPRVGCVLVKAGDVVGQGFHARVGEPHAEAHALVDAGEHAQGATAYVTLEPCSHQGRNPPCADALIAAGVKRVVVCNDDPNPLVAGKGHAKLEAAGIEVIRGVWRRKGRALNQGFLHRMKTGVPWVRLKQAQSLDGRTAMASGESQWITGPKARQDVQYWRARSGAVVTGIETVLADDCRLTVRPDDLPKKYRDLPHDFDQEQPLRVVLDSALRLPLDAKIIGADGRCVVMTCVNDVNKINALEAKGVTVVQVAAQASRVDLTVVMAWLAQAEVNEVLLECGATLAGSAVQQGIINEWLIYTAPVLLGSKARPLVELPLDVMADRAHLDVKSIKQLGLDWRIVAQVNSQE